MKGFSLLVTLTLWALTSAEKSFSLAPGNVDGFLENLGAFSDPDLDSDLRTFGGGGGGDDDKFGGFLGGMGMGGVKKRLYNTSIALTASMFSYYLPGAEDAGGVTDLVNQVVYGLFGTLAVCLIYAIPVLLTGVMYAPSSKEGRDLGSGESPWISSPIMKIENVRRVFNKEFRDEIGLDFEKCLKKTICEAHRKPRNGKFGLLALPFQIFFPPSRRESSSRASSSTPYQLAAAEGSFGKKDCGKTYTCFFDTLDLGTFLIDWYRLRNDPSYEPKDSDFQ